MTEQHLPPRHEPTVVAQRGPSTASDAGPVPGIALGEVIGHGGYATVHLGRQLALDRQVAVKIDSRPLSDERNRRRFLREATAASRISGHPHVVSLIDAGTTSDGRPYLVMEWCPHGSLRDLLRRTGPMPPGEVRDLGLALCSALAAAHEAGVLHRDLKPGNVLIDAYGTPRLSDFGLAALPEPGQDLSVTLEALTPAYAAPEAFTSAEPTAAADVWSMGATLHAMLTTDSPRRAPDGSPASIEHVIAHLTDPLPDPGIPGTEQLMQVIRRATDPDPAARYGSGRELYDALQATTTPGSGGPRLLGGPEAAFTTLPPPSLVGPGPPPRRSARAALVGLAAGLVVGGAAGAVIDRVLTRPSSPPAASRGSGPAAAGAGSAPEVGVCWRGISQIGTSVTSTPASCDEPHYWETYASGLLRTATTPYRDQVDADPAVADTCTAAALKDYLDGAKGPFEVSVIPPDEVSWMSGERGFSCVASRTGAGEVTGSLRGT